MREGKRYNLGTINNYGLLDNKNALYINQVVAGGPNGVPTLNNCQGGTVTMSGIFDNYAGCTINNAGTLSGSLYNGGSLIFDGTGVQTYSGVGSVGVVNGTGSVTFSGPGTVDFNGIDSCSGGTTVAGGILDVPSPGALGGSGNFGNVTVDQGATLAVLVGPGHNGDWNYIPSTDDIANLLGETAGITARRSKTELRWGSTRPRATSATPARSPLRIMTT